MLLKVKPTADLRKVFDSLEKISHSENLGKFIRNERILKTKKLNLIPASVLIDHQNKANFNDMALNHKNTYENVLTPVQLDNIDKRMDISGIHEFSNISSQFSFKFTAAGSTPLSFTKRNILSKPDSSFASISGKKPFNAKKSIYKKVFNDFESINSSNLANAMNESNNSEKIIKKSKRKKMVFSNSSSIKENSPNSSGVVAESFLPAVDDSSFETCNARKSIEEPPGEIKSNERIKLIHQLGLYLKNLHFIFRTMIELNILFANFKFSSVSKIIESLPTNLQESLEFQYLLFKCFFNLKRTTVILFLSICLINLIPIIMFCYQGCC